MPFKFEYFDIKDLVLITPDKFDDERGSFLEIYKKSSFKDAGIDVNFLQCNQSSSKKNVLRGLHYQKHPYGQGKLLRVLLGKIFDVALDLRNDSETFGQFAAVELSDTETQLFYIPPGFAHGFCVVSDKALVEYFTTSEYVPNSEAGIKWDSAGLNIPWPVKEPVLSEKDGKLPDFLSIFNHSKSGLS